MIQTSGEKLKKQFGLDTIANVRICRIYTKSSTPTYHIVFNSRKPLQALPSVYLNDIPFVGFKNGNGEEFYRTPYINIESFVGIIENKFFIVTDLAGYFYRKDKYTESVQRPTLQCQFHGSLLEYVTLPALMDKQANLTSDLTKQYKDIRKTIQKTANKNTKLITTELSGNDVIFKFLTEATEMYEPDHVFKDVDPNSNFSMNPNPSKTYEIWLKFLNVVGDNGWIKAFDTENETITQKDIKDIIAVSNVQIWANDPSFHWQGFNYWNSQLDASIFPTNIAPRVWDKKHGDGQAFFTKHLSQFFDQMKFFTPQMASALTSLFRKEGILPKYKRR
jgi:hypothetical protein